MKVLLVGGGGREHALARMIAASPLVDALYAAPGNPGIRRHARLLPLGGDDHGALLAAARREGVDFAVVGPEVPLVAGLADRLNEAGITTLGPGARAAAIEGSKAFAKDLMARHGIPTARFATFREPAAARAYARELGAPVVVKTDGLAAGKGSLVCATLAEADDAIAACLERGVFGLSGATIVIEEFLRGEEASFFALANGPDVIPLASAQDHKTVFDGDRGPNTGGMGAFSPFAPLDAAMQARVMREIVRPTIAALAAEAAPYRGILYAGLMLTADGPKVIEFNCRWGDPECEPILARAGSDLVPLFLAAARGEPMAPPPAWRPEASVCVVLVSGGYPGSYRTGIPIEGVGAAEAEPGVSVLHAGTAERDGQLVTNGGRVLAVTSVGADLESAIRRAYAGVARIKFEGMHYRYDIGRRRAR
ncbi:MAG: phosphoribosylamine--glycine ligase [Candidatus Rokubacteria bacterium]|nr:phosphoribosylamine--glycine ligase [Candidatus Rokubacteria bacterium]